jgi:hypothetical protein
MTQAQLFHDPAPANGAILSSCGLYRYRLWRTVSLSFRRLLWLCLNSSTADAIVNDPSVTRMMGFAKQWGFGRMDVVNLFAFRSSNPKALLGVADPVGPENDNHIAQAVAEAEVIVAGWGSSIPRKLLWRRDSVRRLLVGKTVMCLNKTEEGDPRHPLYLPKTVPLEVLWQPNQ